MESTTIVEFPFHDQPSFTTNLNYAGPNPVDWQQSLGHVHRFLELEKQLEDLKTQNAQLEMERERLINDLMDVRVAQIEDRLAIQGDAQGHLNAQELELANEHLKQELMESASDLHKLKSENKAMAERLYEMQIEKERLHVRLTHAEAVADKWQERAETAEGELGEQRRKNIVLSDKVEELEEKLNRIEEGDFEHVSANGLEDFPTPGPIMDV